MKEPTTTPTTSTPETKPQETKPDAPVIPDKYDFKAPEGAEFDRRAIEAATPIFKELGLTQAQAQKLVDFYTARSTESSKNLLKLVDTMREGWRNQVSADKEMEGKLDVIKADVGRALNSLGDPKLVAEFKTAMDETGAGDHPAFVKAFWKLSQKINEGTHVAGTGPSPNGQTAKPSTPPTLAEAMYGHLRQ